MQVAASIKQWIKTITNYEAKCVLSSRCSQFAYLCHDVFVLNCILLRDIFVMWCDLLWDLFVTQCVLWCNVCYDVMCTTWLALLQMHCLGWKHTQQCLNQVDLNHLLVYRLYLFPVSYFLHNTIIYLCPPNCVFMYGSVCSV